MKKMLKVLLVLKMREKRIVLVNDEQDYQDVQ